MCHDRHADWFVKRKKFEGDEKETTLRGLESYFWNMDAFVNEVPPDALTTPETLMRTYHKSRHYASLYGKPRTKLYKFLPYDKKTRVRVIRNRYFKPNHSKQVLQTQAPLRMKLGHSKCPGPVRVCLYFR